MNLVVGDPAQDVTFEAVGMDGLPVTLLAGQVFVADSSIATLDGLRLRARAQGSTALTIRIGDRLAYAAVHTYERALSPEGIRPGQHLAVPLHISGGEMLRWRLSASAEGYYVAMLPEHDNQPLPRFVIVGASCVPALDAHSFFCLAQHGASVTVYHPQQIDPKQELAGSLAVWRQSWK